MNIGQKEAVSTKERVYEGDDALDVLDGINELYVPDDETLRKLIIGPSGKLRAPVIRKGKKLIVGFSAEAYEKVLAKK